MRLQSSSGDTFCSDGVSSQVLSDSIVLVVPGTASEESGSAGADTSQDCKASTSSQRTGPCRSAGGVRVKPVTGHKAAAGSGAKHKRSQAARKAARKEAKKVGRAAAKTLVSKAGKPGLARKNGGRQGVCSGECSM